MLTNEPSGETASRSDSDANAAGSNASFQTDAGETLDGFPQEEAQEPSQLSPLLLVVPANPPPPIRSAAGFDAAPVTDAGGHPANTPLRRALHRAALQLAQWTDTAAQALVEISIRFERPPEPRTTLAARLERLRGHPRVDRLAREYQDVRRLTDEAIRSLVGIRGRAHAKHLMIAAMFVVAFLIGRYTVVPEPNETEALVSAASFVPIGVEPLSLRPIVALDALKPGVRDDRWRPPASVSAPAPQPVETRAIQRVLNKYRDAYSVLDVAAAKAVWPTVDAMALGMTFGRVADQNYEYDGCRIAVADLRAEAVCRGTAEYRHFRNDRMRQESRQWRFSLRKVKEDWVIDTVQAQ